MLRRLLNRVVGVGCGGVCEVSAIEGVVGWVAEEG